MSSLCGVLNKTPVLMFRAALRRERRPGRVTRGEPDLQLVLAFGFQPSRDVLARTRARVRSFADAFRQFVRDGRRRRSPLPAPPLIPVSARLCTNFRLIAYSGASSFSRACSAASSGPMPNSSPMKSSRCGASFDDQLRAGLIRERRRDRAARPANDDADPDSRFPERPETAHPDAPNPHGYKDPLQTGKLFMKFPAVPHNESLPQNGLLRKTDCRKGFLSLR